MQYIWVDNSDIPAVNLPHCQSSPARQRSPDEAVHEDPDARSSSKLYDMFCQRVLYKVGDAYCAADCLHGHFGIPYVTVKDFDVCCIMQSSSSSLVFFHIIVYLYLDAVCALTEAAAMYCADCDVPTVTVEACMTGLSMGFQLYSTYLMCMR